MNSKMGTQACVKGERHGISFGIAIRHVTRKACAVTADLPQSVDGFRITDNFNMNKHSVKRLFPGLPSGFIVRSASSSGVIRDSFPSIRVAMRSSIHISASFCCQDIILHERRDPTVMNGI